MPRLLLACALFVSFLGPVGVPKTAYCKLEHGLFWYGTSPNDSVDVVTAKRYSSGITGRMSNDQDKVRIRALNPDFKWYVYNSVTDNYVSPNQDTGEHDALVALALKRGWDPEIGYLHYWDDTQLVIQGKTLLIPGWGGGSSTDPAQSRVPVYYSNLTRRLCNFSTPQAATLYRQLMVSLAFDTPFTGTTLYPDGIFLDNSSPTLFNYGTIVSGGHVRELPQHSVVGSSEFMTWFWERNLGPFLTSLKDTLQTSASWSKDRHQKYVMINVSNVWKDDYGTRNVADVLAMEFQYNPVRNPGLTAIDQSYEHDATAAASGLTSFYMSTNTRTVIGHSGSFGLSEVMLGNLCWFLLSRTSQSIFYQQGTNTPATAGWDSLTWIGAMDVADTRLGEAVGAPYVLAQGTDPLGHPYAVHARQYQNGFVVLRNRGSWDEGIEPETAVTVALPDTFESVSPNGTLQAKSTKVSLRNGQGALFLYTGTVVVSPPPPPPPPPPDTTATSFSFIVLRDHRKAIVQWETPTDLEDLSGFDIYRQAADSAQTQVNRTLIPPAATAFVDVPAPREETRYWMMVHEENGTETWYGPVVVASQLDGRGLGIIPSLSQNVPNPAHAGGHVDIQFSIAREGVARLEVFDLSGRRIAVLQDGFHGVGNYNAGWNVIDEHGIPLTPGVYIYRLQSADGTLSRKLLIIRE